MSLQSRRPTSSCITSSHFPHAKPRRTACSAVWPPDTRLARRCREALRESGRTGIAKIIIREAQHLAAVEVIDNAIVLTLLRYADELVDTSPLSFPGGEKPRKAELDESLMRLIKARIKGQKPRLPAPEGEPQASEVVDLMERLRQSLDSRKRPAHNAAKKSLPKAGKRAGRKARHAA